MSSRNPKKPAPGSVGEHLAHLMRVGMRLIPLDRGAKTTHETGWADAGEATIAGLVERAGRLWREPAASGLMDVPLGSWIDTLPSTGLNFGVLHKQSGTVCLDLDHPMALQALQAGVEAVGGPTGYLPTSDASWTSVRGRKWLWKAPRELAGRSVRLNARRRLPNDKIVSEVVLELRGAGQDMIPPGYRADAERVLTWDRAPDRIPALPTPVARLLRALLDNDVTVVTAMQLAVGVPRELVGMDATHVDDYPSRLAAAVHERMLVNTNVDLAGLLVTHGFTQNGRRWREPGSTHADGITMPAGNRENWHCWHESSVLAGQFDAWRAYVELEHAGNLAEAKDAARRAFGPKIRLVPDPLTEDSGDEMRTILTGIPHDEKMVQGTKISSSEMPPEGLKTAPQAPAARSSHYPLTYLARGRYARFRF